MRMCVFGFTVVKSPRRVRWTRLAVVMSAAALAAATTTAVASAAATPTTTATLDQTARTSAAMIATLPHQACPPGASALRPARAWRTAHGAAVYHYAMATGPGFDSYVPPTGFKPLLASNAVLAEMHMDTRPKDPRKLSQWVSDMKAYKGTRLPSPCAFPATHTSRTPLPPHRTANGSAALPAIIPENHINAANWAGYADYAGPGQRFTKVSAHIVPPAPGNCACSIPNDAVSWVGLGAAGDGGGLLQDGIIMQEVSSFGYLPPFTWFDYVASASGQGVTTSLVETGDVGSWGVDIAMATEVSSPDTVTFTAVSQGVMIMDTVESGNAVFQDWDPATAEFITERPDACTFPDVCYDPMSNFGTIPWSSAEVMDTDGNLFAVGDPAVTPTAYLMNSNPPSERGCVPGTLAYPTGLGTQSESSFLTVWCTSSGP